jgi:hypothetical protein
MQDIVNVKNLYNKYLERENWFEYYLNNSVIPNSKFDIIWSEASKFNNDYYVYKQHPFGKYINYGKKNGYFSNVTEAVFGSSICIDFYSPFGFNLSQNTRQFLNKIYQNNTAFYNAYLDKYIHSILTILGYGIIDVKNLNNVIVSPQDTRDNILKYLKLNIKYAKPIKCYKISSRGLATSNFEML